MAQYKHELSTVVTKCKDPSKKFPWYRERLHLKFLKSKRSAIYNGVNWTFIPSGTDDFRTGIPRNTSGTILHQWSKPVPLIGMAGTRKTRSYCSRLNMGDETRFSKMGPRSRLQREYLRAVELGMLKHPFVLFPRLTEAIPEEMVYDLIRFLDPSALNKEDITPETCLEASLSEKMIQQSLETPHPSVCSFIQKSEEQSLANCHHLIYKFPLKKTADEIERDKNLLASQEVISVKQQSRVNNVTRDLIQWVAQLGRTEDLDEHTIRSLFGSDYETKPISMAPIQVVELDGVPNELEFESHGSSQQSEKYKPLFHYYGYQRVGSSGEISYLDNGEHHVVKTKYGAWYLPTRLWKVRHWNEPLNDPEVVAAEETCGKDKRQQDLDEGFSELHGAKAFKEFILTKKSGVGMPSFLKSVDLTSDWITRNS